MFSFFSAPQVLPTDLENESESVKNFLKNSYYFQQMKISAKRFIPNPGEINGLQRHITYIENATRYSALQYVLRDAEFDVAIADNLFAYNMGHNKMSYFTRALGLFSENAYFYHHGINLYKEVEIQYEKYYQFINKLKQQFITISQPLLDQSLPQSISDIVIEYATDGFIRRRGR